MPDGAAEPGTAGRTVLALGGPRRWQFQPLGLVSVCPGLHVDVLMGFHIGEFAKRVRSWMTGRLSDLLADWHNPRAGRQIPGSLSRVIVMGDLGWRMPRLTRGLRNSSRQR